MATTSARPRPSKATGEVLGLLLFGLLLLAAAAFASRTLTPASGLVAAAAVVGAIGWIRHGAFRRRERRLQELLEQTEERLAEETKRRKNVLRAIIQDINAPTTPIRIQLATLENDRTLTGPQKQAIKVIQANMRRLERLMQDLAVLHEIEGGAFELVRAEVDLRDMLHQVHEDRVKDANAYGVSLALIAQADLPVAADADRLIRVIDDLVLNVLAYTARGASGQIIGGINEDRARVEIRDGARGFTDREMQMLFQPIGDLHKAGERRERGTGIDLVLARQVIEAHGGRIWVENRGADRGASFLFDLPMRPRPGLLQPTTAPVPARPI